MPLSQSRAAPMLCVASWTWLFITSWVEKAVVVRSWNRRSLWLLEKLCRSITAFARTPVLGTRYVPGSLPQLQYVSRLMRRGPHSIPSFTMNSMVKSFVF